MFLLITGNQTSGILICKQLNQINMEDLEKDYNDGLKLLQKHNTSQWINILKEIAKKYLTSQKGKSLIDSIDTVILSSEKGNTVKIELISNIIAYEDIKITLTPLSILIEQQKCHTKFEQVTRIPLSIFQLI